MHLLKARQQSVTVVQPLHRNRLMQNTLIVSFCNLLGHKWTRLLSMQTVSSQLLSHLVKAGEKRLGSSSECCFSFSWLLMQQHTAWASFEVRISQKCLVQVCFFSSASSLTSTVTTNRAGVKSWAPKAGSWAPGSTQPSKAQLKQGFASVALMHKLGRVQLPLLISSRAAKISSNGWDEARPVGRH